MSISKVLVCEWLSDWRGHPLSCSGQLQMKKSWRPRINWAKVWLSTLQCITCGVVGQKKALLWPHCYSCTQIDVSISYRIKFWWFSFFWFLCRPKNDRVRAFWKMMIFHGSERRRLQQGAKSLAGAFCCPPPLRSMKLDNFQNALTRSFLGLQRIQKKENDQNLILKMMGTSIWVQL